jgi:hypothetical protein
LFTAGVSIFLFFEYKKTIPKRTVSTEIVDIKTASSTNELDTQQEQVINNVQMPRSEEVVPKVVTPVQDIPIATKTLSEDSSLTLDIQTVLPCETLFTVQKFDSNRSTFTAEEEKKEFERLNNASEVSAFEVCMVDKLASSSDFKQKLLTTYINTINKTYSIDLLSLSVLDRTDMILQHEKEIARKLARQAYVKALVSGTLMSVYICLGDGHINEPKDASEMCLSGAEMWPDLSAYGGRWGGCATEINYDDYTFKYCAILPDNTVWVCTQERCAPSI